MGVLKADTHMTAERAERVEFAEAVADRLKNPLDKSPRKGGYFLNSAGTPVDCDGRAIPEAEWKPEDRARLRPETVQGEEQEQEQLPGDVTAPVRQDGADVVEPSGSEKRTGSRQAPRARMNPTG